MLGIYEIDDDYIDYLRTFDNKVLKTKVEDRTTTRKYVGVLLHNREFKYFVPLTSYKSEIYDNMSESISLKKIGTMAVLRINNMIPVIDDVIHGIDFKLVDDKKYAFLLYNEYRIIKDREREIRKDSRIVYFYRLNDKNKDKGLYKICCDFKLLEEACLKYGSDLVTQEAAATLEPKSLDAF